MHVYLLQTYCHTSYSYDGLSECDLYVFSTQEKAIEWATKNGYKVVEWADSPKDVIITEHEVL